jgi:hypothetical protein
MRKVSYSGAEATLIAAVSEKYYRFVGEAVALEAIWGYLNTTDVRRSGWTSIGIRLEERIKYKRFTCRLDTGMYDMAMLHPMGLKTSDEQYLFVMPEKSDEPPEHFFNVLNRRVRVPIIQEWSTFLWQAGKERKHNWEYLINEMDGDGEVGYVLHSEFTTDWETIVREIINGTISLKAEDGVLPITSNHS